METAGNTEPLDRSGHLLRSTSRWLALLVPVVLFVFGMRNLPIAMLGEHRDRIPGDLGDSRFNNYVLEHFHQYAIGHEKSYWDAPFMYPYKNVIAFSDNLLGTAPIYSAFRRGGFNRESAYQVWILSMFVLNYLCCYFALLAWSRRSVLAACGAFIFAFGIWNIGQLEHAQVFPKFMVPLAFWWCWKWLSTGRAKFMLLAALAIVYQFYCGVYLGFILCYGLMFLVIGYALIHFRELLAYRHTSWRPFAKGAGALAVSALLLWPLMRPYAAVSKAIGLRKFEEVQATIPRPQSYFFTHPAALSWRSLSRHSQFAFDEWWSHFHFMGAVPWLAILFVPFLLWKSRADTGSKKPVAVLAIGFLLSTLFCLRIGDFTLYKFIFDLPGFGALRAIDRIINVQAMYFAALTVMVFATVMTKPWMSLILGSCLPLAVVIENQVDVDELKHYDKYEARKLVDRIVLDVQLQYDGRAAAIAYTPARCVLNWNEDHVRSIDMHLSAMLAAQQLGIPIVNAYTGSYPGNYMGFWDQQDQRALDDWCAYNGIASTGIQMMNNIHRPIMRTDTIHLRAPNGKYVCIDPTRQDEAFADRATPQLWETFVRLRLSDRQFAFMAHTDRFITAELHHEGKLVATTDRLGDMGIFILEDQPDGQVALRADNGKYIALDSTSLRLVARADSVGRNCLFTIEPVR